MSLRPVSKPSPSAPGSPTDKQVCIYIAEMAAELRHLANRPRFRTLSYLLDMARLESERMAKSLPD